MKHKNQYKLKQLKQIPIYKIQIHLSLKKV